MHNTTWNNLFDHWGNIFGCHGHSHTYSHNPWHGCHTHKSPVNMSAIWIILGRNFATLININMKIADMMRQAYLDMQSTMSNIMNGSKEFDVTKPDHLIKMSGEFINDSLNKISESITNMSKVFVDICDATGKNIAANMKENICCPEAECSSPHKCDKK